MKNLKAVINFVIKEIDYWVEYQVSGIHYLLHYQYEFWLEFDIFKTKNIILLIL